MDVAHYFSPETVLLALHKVPTYLRASRNVNGSLCEPSRLRRLVNMSVGPKHPALAEKARSAIWPKPKF